MLLWMIKNTQLEYAVYFYEQTVPSMRPTEASSLYKAHHIFLITVLTLQYVQTQTRVSQITLLKLLQIFRFANPRGKLFVESPLCPFLMLSLAISSLGKQDGGRWRKIIWTFGPAMDPLPQRGVRGAGRGDSLGQYSGAGGGSSSGEGGGVELGESQGGVRVGRPLRSASFKVKSAECWDVEVCVHKFMLGCLWWKSGGGRFEW